jgi:hypothetical protein
MISNLVFKVCGIVPGSGWFEGFERQNHDAIQFSQGSGLDPIRAQCFSWAAVATHFHWFDKEVKDKHILPCNIWNMDEKGIQLAEDRSVTALSISLPGIKSTKYSSRATTLSLSH